METLKKPTAEGNQQIGCVLSDFTKHNTARKVRKETKEFVILYILAQGKSLNRFEAIRLHDTALNSTVSTLQGKGLIIHRKRETVPCVNGTKKVDVMRYSLTPDQIPVALKMLGLESVEAAA